MKLGNWFICITIIVLIHCWLKYFLSNRVIWTGRFNTYYNFINRFWTLYPVIVFSSIIQKMKVINYNINEWIIQNIIVIEKYVNIDLTYSLNSYKVWIIGTINSNLRFSFTVNIVLQQSSVICLKHLSTQYSRWVVHKVPTCDAGGY